MSTLAKNATISLTKKDSLWEKLRGIRKDFLLYLDYNKKRRKKDMDINELRMALDNGVPVEYSSHCQKRMLIISACYPDADHWLADNKTRRK